MRLNIDLEDATVSNLLILAAKNKLQFEDLLKNLIDSGVELAMAPDAIELDDEKIESVARDMYQVALTVPDEKNILVPWLYRKTTETRWTDLSPNTRKSIGRRFSKVAKEYEQKAALGEPVVISQGKNAQNATEYQTKRKNPKTDA